MGDVAGSGGYFVSIPADKIVAHPATLTASIGVLSGKFLSTNFWDKLGISWDEVHTSSNAQIFTGLSDFTPEQRVKFEAELDRIYEDFTSKVADGRKLPKEEVLKIAKGRVWTGEDALALGLVDALGGFPVALKLVRQAAGLSADAKIKLKEFPAKKSLIQKVARRRSRQQRTDRACPRVATRSTFRTSCPASRLARQSRRRVADAGSCHRITTSPVRSATPAPPWFGSKLLL